MQTIKDEAQKKVNDYTPDEAYNTNLTLGGDRAVGSGVALGATHQHIPYDIPASKGT